MRVLISGGGVAGPTLAWFLACTSAQHHVTIVEKAPRLLPHGQNVDIEGSAVTVVKKMGLMDEVRRFNTTEKGTHFMDDNGRPFAPFPMRPGSTSSPTSELEILRGDLAAILYRATEDMPNVTYRFDTTVKQVITNDDELVKVELSDGTVEEYDVLVAADGQWSRVRKQCFPDDSIKVVDTGAYVAYWTVPRLPSDSDWWSVHVALGSRIIMARPDPHGTYRAAVSCMPLDAQKKAMWQRAVRSDRKTQEEVVKSEFLDVKWESRRLLGAMSAAPDFYFHALQQIKMAKWSTSRVVCIGDAAFAPTPLTGAGTSLALVSGYLLAGELSKLDDGEAPGSAFDAYENLFHPFVEKQQQIPSIFPGIIHPRTAWKRWALGFGLSAVSRVVALVMATPWLVRRFDSSNEANDDGFPLPLYPTLAEEGSTEKE